MKILGATIGMHIGIFVWCLFMGVTAISIGVGAAWPPLNMVAQPFVCPGGQMTFNQETSNPLPGTTYTTTGWTCVDQTGEPRTLDIFTIALPAGVIYGLGLWVLVLLFMWNAQRRGAAVQPAYPAPRHNAPRYNYDSSRSAPRPAAGSAHSVARMQELQALRDKNLISEAQFEQKRDEILKDL